MSTNMGPVSRRAVAAAESRVPRPPEPIGSGFLTAALLIAIAVANVILTGAGVELPVPVLAWITWPGNLLLGLLVSEPRDIFSWIPSATDGMAPVLLDILAVVLANVVAYVLPVHWLRKLLYRFRSWRRRRALAELEPEMPEFRVTVAHDPYEAELKKVLGED